MLPGKGFVAGLIFFIVLAVLPAIFEELFCRKTILNTAKRYGNTFAVIFSALFFAIISAIFFSLVNHLYCFTYF